MSEERCNAYKKYLRYDQGTSNFWRPCKIQADSKDSSGKPLLTYGIAQHGSFDDAVCGKLKP